MDSHVLPFITSLFNLFSSLYPPSLSIFLTESLPYIFFSRREDCFYPPFLWRVCSSRSLGQNVCACPVPFALIAYTLHRIPHTFSPFRGFAITSTSRLCGGLTTFAPCALPFALCTILQPSVFSLFTCLTPSPPKFYVPHIPCLHSGLTHKLFPYV